MEIQSQCCILTLAELYVRLGRVQMALERDPDRDEEYYRKKAAKTGKKMKPKPAKETSAQDRPMVYDPSLNVSRPVGTGWKYW